MPINPPHCAFCGAANAAVGVVLALTRRIDKPRATILSTAEHHTWSACDVCATQIPLLIQLRADEAA